LSADDEIEKLREDILNSMTKLEDPTYRAVLSLMLRVSTSQQKLLNEMIQKVDVVIEDDKRLRAIVLNGHLENHEDHHDWVDKHLNRNNNLDYMVSLVEDRKKHGGYCDWAHKKMTEEQTTHNSNRDFFRGILEKALAAGLIFFLGFHFQRLFPFFFGG
jgi:hypothetical protein